MAEGWRTVINRSAITESTALPTSGDTSFEIERRQIKHWRQMSAAQKGAIVSGLTQAVYDLARAGEPRSTVAIDFVAAIREYLSVNAPILGVADLLARALRES